MTQLKDQQSNDWAAPPISQTTTIRKTVPKINESLESDEFEVELIPTDSLSGLSYKSIKVKIHEKENKKDSLVHHYFMHGLEDEEDALKKVLNIPEKIQKNFKTW